MATVGQQPTGPLGSSQPSGQATAEKNFKSIVNIPLSALRNCARRLRLPKPKKLAQLENRPRSLLLSQRERTYTLDQMKSTLFSKLPPEVRLMIYQHVLGGRNYLFYTSLGMLHDGNYAEILGRRDQATKMYIEWCWLSTTESVHIPEVDICSHMDLIYRKWKSLPLLLTCRKMQVAIYTYHLLPNLGILTNNDCSYSEAIEVLYRDSIFSFYYPRHVLDLCKALPPHHFASIVSLQIYHPIPWYLDDPNYLRVNEAKSVTAEEPWSVIASMKSLRILRVFIFQNVLNTGARVYPPPSLDWQAKILRPLRVVKGLDVFDVVCYWKTPESKDLPDLGDVPFRLVRLNAGCEARLKHLVDFAPLPIPHFQQYVSGRSTVRMDAG